MKYSKLALIEAFQKGWYAVDDYDDLSSAMEDFVGRIEADEADAEPEAYEQGYVDAEIRLNDEGEKWDFDRDSDAMEDMRLRRDSR